MTSCRLCGRTSEDEFPLGWSAETIKGRRHWVCERCTRENVRAIEAKLEQEWW
jgi:hypothetical protein